MKLNLEAYKLVHDGSLALSKIESNGIRIDVDLLDRNMQKVSKKISRIEEEMKEDDTYKVWEKRFGDKTNIGSGVQLGTILFDELGLKCKERTAKGMPKTDQAALSAIDLPFIALYLQRGKLFDIRDTFLAGIKRETINGFLHNNFNLHLARTFRSSSDNINFQNLPTRDEEAGRLIRSIFIPRKGRKLAEFDFKGIEVCVFGDYCKDHRWMQDVSDPTKDMHRDMSSKIFKLEDLEIPKEWWKDKHGGHAVRYSAKNMFVFPEFYGDWYKNCAKNLWNFIVKHDLKTPSGMGMKEHLALQKIKSCGRCDPERDAVKGTFEYHIKEIENYFWNERYAAATSWKKSFYKKYLERGYFTMYTGFTCEGVFNRKEVINYPVQGSAFHILLLTIIKLQRWLTKNKMLSLIIGQIHDSLLMDMILSEEEAIVRKIKHIVNVEIPREWKWIIVPMEIEIEMAPIDGSWHEKKAVKL